MLIIFSIIFAIIITFVGLKNYLITYLSITCIDIPNDRSSHNNPLATGGGISFFITSLIFCSILGNIQPLISAPLGIVGFIDDKYGVKKRYRFIAQILTIFLIIKIFLIGQIYNFGFNNILNLAIIFFLIFSGVAFINFINFMDGIDGLLGNCAIILILLSIILNKSYSLLPLTGSLIAFSFFNWNPAKVFMGDCGSTYLAGILVTCIYGSNSINNCISLLLASSPLLFDALVTVIRRFLNKENILAGHRKHLFQRLVKAGFTQKETSLRYILSVLLLSLSAIFLNIYFQVALMLIIFSYGIHLDRYKAQSFN